MATGVTPATSRPPVPVPEEAALPADFIGPPRPPRPTAAACADPHHDQALLDACRNAAATSSRPTNDRILYVGLNEDSMAAESGALAARSAGLVRVEPRGSASVAFGGVAFDLASPEGPAAFASALALAHGMPEAQASALARVLTRAPLEGRSELARIALVWAPAELGAAIPSRVVLSGHSTAGLLWGHHASFSYESFRALARALPTAARQIEDVHLSGCFTEREIQSAASWVNAFPSLKTLWGYREFCPASPTTHLADWERATRGRSARLTEPFAAAHGSVTAWSLAGGVVAASLSLDERRALATEADGRFASYFSGERRIVQPHEPGPDRDYAAYQMVAAHPAASPAERAAAAQHGAQLLRLRFYEQSVRGEFSRENGRTVDAALTRLGLPPADFAQLSRRSAVELAGIVADRAPPNPDPSMKHALGLLAGLTDLRPDVIPDRYCH